MSDCADSATPIRHSRTRVSLGVGGRRRFSDPKELIPAREEGDGGSCTGWGAGRDRRDSDEEERMKLKMHAIVKYACET